ncbi:MAG: NUDIX domain-containing protein [Candidatus Dependentiae bacterium]
MNFFFQKLIDQATDDGVQKLSIAGVIIHDQKLLVLKRLPDDFMPNIYELPGGGLECNETLLDALYREIKEETSCIIDHIVGYVGYIDFPSSSGKLTRRFNFLVKPKTPFLITLSEHADYAWISPEDADNYDITVQTKGIIACVKENKIHYL